jgi:membrane protein implicated in regulation of membrane protease activity
MVKEKAKVSKSFENGEGKVFFRGADWMAFTKSDTEFKEGETVIIAKVDGIKLEVKPL